MLFVSKTSVRKIPYAISIYHTIKIVPVAMSAQPMSDFTVNVSCKKINAKTKVKIMLSLSTADTSVAFPSWSAR